MKKRRLVQWLSTLAHNAYLPGFWRGQIYTGTTKRVCLPGFNCYSCPGAVGACPIGALQAVLGSVKTQVSLYVTGLLLLFGMVAGRWICGWLCPFGLFQELLYKIRSPKWKLPARLRPLKATKVVLLVVLVILLPMFAVNFAGQGDPWYCKYVCPNGTIFGALPLMATNPSLRAAAGWLFSWKMLVAVVTVALCVVLYRWFCKFLCPLGAIYGLLNRLSVYRMHLNEHACVHCGACARVCRMDVDPTKSPNSAECIRCGDCVKACPHRALRMGISVEVEDSRERPHPAERL